MKKWLRRLPGAVVVLVVGSLLLYGFWPVPIQVEVVPAKRGALQVTVNDDGEPIREHVTPRAVFDETPFREPIHLRFVGADERVHARALHDLTGQEVRSGDVEPHAGPSCGLEGAADLGHDVGEARRHAHGQGLGRGGRCASPSPAGCAPGWSNGG